ncbi:MAG: hypothetical protein JSV44_09775 [Candidatus Zixiibacteriota bacterium]|nr:MAG: hypothetical protein JSV44_09775 [candidate division Zixibacteria bacterium]
MSRKKRPLQKPKAKIIRTSSGFNPEGNRYYFPVVAAILLVGVVILFGRFLFSDLMLYGSDTINAGIFFRHFYVDYVQTHGTVPVWNPYIFGGMPFIDAFHGDIFYPLSVLKFFGNFYRMLGINLVLHIFLAGIFMYFTARQFRLGRIASTVSATGYMFSGLLVSLVAPGHDGKIFVTTLFPLTILFLNRAFERKPVLNFALLGLVIGVIILSPHPQLSYYSLWAIALYSIFKLIIRYRETRSVAAVAKPSVMLAAAVVVGLMISAIQFYPGYIYTTEYSPRADTKKGYDWAISWSMNEEEAFSLVVPEFSGTNSGQGNYYWGKNAFKDNSEYAGVISLFLAVIGVFFLRKRESLFFGGLALFAFVYALGGTTPIFRVFYYLIPNVKSLRAPSTIMFIFLFCVTLLSGMGLQYIIDKGRELETATRKKLLVYLTAVPGALFLGALLFAAAGESMLSLYSSIFYGEITTAPIGQGYTKWNAAMMNLPNVQSGFWIVFVLVGLSAALIFMYNSRKVGAAALLVIPFLVMVDGIRFDSRFISTYNPGQNFSRNALVDHLGELPGPFRVLNLNVVPADYLPFFGIQVVAGYHGNQLRWYDDFLGGPALTNLRNPYFLNLVGVKYILAKESMQIPPNALGPDSVVAIKQYGGITLYRNDNSLPRTFLVDRYEIIPDRKDIYSRILAGTSDLSQMVFLEEEPPLAVTPADSTAGTAEIVSYQVDSVVISVEVPHNSMLVLTDNYYFAWKALVDGMPAEIMRADGSFRAVPLQAGASRVVFTYDRGRNILAGTVTLLTLLLVAIILTVYLFLCVKKRKKVPATE